MSKPSRFKYGPYDFDIIYLDDLLDRSDSLGETHFNHLEILLDSRMKPQMEKETLLHELLHVALRDIGFFPDGDSEERFIRLLSPRLSQMFSDNKELTKYVFSLEGKDVRKPRKPKRK